MDITPIFFDFIKTVKKTNQAVGEMEQHKPTTATVNSVSHNSSSKKTCSEFANKVKDLVTAINKMKDFLNKHRKDYINIYSPLLSHASSMTDKERDQIDADVSKFMKLCNDMIKSLRSEVKRKKSCQLKDHQTWVVDLIEKYLQEVCNIHSEQRAVRVKRAIEKQRMMRLENLIGNRSTEKRNSVDSNETLSLNNIPSLEEMAMNNSSSLNNKETEFTQEELQMFEEENNIIYDEMNSRADEVKQIEGKVLEIAKLQEIFTEKVLQQEVDMNRVNETAISSTENIRGASEQLREAMKKNAGFRVWILFFIITLAFTILFLDWYNL